MKSEATDRWKLDRADWLAIGAIALVAIVVRLVFILALPPVLHPDSDSYFEIAARLWQGEGFGDLSRRTPFYPLFIWLTGWSDSAGLLPVVVVQHLLGVATIVAVYLSARRLLGERMRPAAVISGLVLAVVPYPILVEHSILSESLFMFLLAAAAYSLLVWWDDGRGWLAVCCGALLGLAVLTRPAAVGVFPLWAGILLLLNRKNWRRAGGFAIRAGLAWAALLLPLQIRNYTAMGSFSLQRSLGRNLISVADRWVSYGVVNEGGVYPEVQAIYGKYLTQKRGPDAVVVYAAMPELRRATGWTDWEIDRALAAIARQGIREHPQEFLTTRLQRLPLLFRDPAPAGWYALETETYLPFLSHLGRINPELVSRSAAGSGLASAKFDLAANAYEALSVNAFSFDLLGGKRWVLLLFGFAGIVFIERRRVACLLAGTLAYLWLGTILLQPANARYRVPGMPWEAVFAAAGLWFVVRAAAWVIRKVSRRAEMRTSDAAVVGMAVATLVVVLGARAWAVQDRYPVIRTADFSTHLLQELQVEGRTLTVLYWEGAEEAGEQGGGETASAEVDVSRGGDYTARLFYSCEIAACAGARIQIVAVDREGRTLAEVSEGLSQERVDNDLFWDQMELAVNAPGGTQKLRVEINLQNGSGSLVVPWIAVRGAAGNP